jgi:N-acetylgalactosamine kinase
LPAVSPFSTPAAPGLRSAARLHRDLRSDEPATREQLASVYGADAERLAERRGELARTLERFLEAFGDLPCAVYRSPARISLNPHCDHQGAWVPYGLHRRELLYIAAPVDDDRIELANVDPAFAPLLAFSMGEEIARAPAAWAEGWFSYLEAPEVTAEVRRNLDAKTQREDRHATVNYVKAAALRVRQALPESRLPGLRVVLNGNIPQGGGLSSSSALVVNTTLALTELSGHPEDPRTLAERCGEAEWLVGTRGGSGDHAAMLLGSREGLTHLRFQAPFGVRGVRRSPFPPGYELILANSQTRSEKSAEERLLFNRGIFAYRFAYLALREEMKAIGVPERVLAETECLGDLHSGRVLLADLYRLLLRLPETVSAAQLAARFPQTFPAGARGCFGTEEVDRLPTDIPLRGAAMYGLGRVDRGRAMPDLLDGDAADMAEFGHLMTITHDGDRLFQHGQPYRGNRESLSDARLRVRLREVENGIDHPLYREPGFYGASIAELDRMVDVALETEGVLGAGLMGAGGGGYVLILARAGAAEAVQAALLREYYEPTGKEPEVEPWRPAPAAGRVL